MTYHLNRAEFITDMEERRDRQELGSIRYRLLQATLNSVKRNQDFDPQKLLVESTYNPLSGRLTTHQLTDRTVSRRTIDQLFKRGNF